MTRAAFVPVVHTGALPIAGPTGAKRASGRLQARRVLVAEPIRDDRCCMWARPHPAPPIARRGMQADTGRKPPPLLASTLAGRASASIPRRRAQSRARARTERARAEQIGRAHV